VLPVLAAFCLPIWLTTSAAVYLLSSRPSFTLLDNHHQNTTSTTHLSPNRHDLLFPCFLTAVQ
jgi:hypothetical protein